MTDFYSEIADGYDELHGEEQLRKLETISRHFTPRGPMLDIGAGTGISTRFFGVEAIALDPSPGLLARHDGDKVVGSAEDLPFPDRSFSSIISVTALHHADIDKALGEIRRVSKEDCIYAFSILKKAKNFDDIINKLKSNFELKEIDEEKDLILVSRTC